jgi:hypothetical protein
VLRLRPLSLARCNKTSRREDFTSGRYRAHTTELGLEKGQKVTLELRREKGRWKPRLEVLGEGVSVKTLASGKIGARSLVSVAAAEAAEVSVRIGGWDPDLPADAAYVLEANERCRRGR